MAEEINKKTVLLVATIASFLTPFMGSSVNVALPVIAKELAVNAILLSWITTSFLLTSAMFAVPFGRIADIYGMKRIFILGMILFTISSFLASLSPSVEFLIFSRVVQGIGSAMIFVTGVAIIAYVFPQRERGRAIGIAVTAVYIGLFLGPVLGGLLTQYMGWRSIFYLMVPLGLLVTALIFFKMRGTRMGRMRGRKTGYSWIYTLQCFTFTGFSGIFRNYGLNWKIDAYFWYYWGNRVCNL